MSSPVANGLNATFNIYALMSIQNNLAENKKSILCAISQLTGLKPLESVERRIRAAKNVRNHPALLDEIQITRNVRGDFAINNLKLIEYADLLEREIIV